HAAAKTGRAELQIAGEGVADLLGGRGIVGIRLLQEVLERRPGDGIGVVGDPGGDPGAQPGVRAGGVAGRAGGAAAAGGRPVGAAAGGRSGPGAHAPPRSAPAGAPAPSAAPAVTRRPVSASRREMRGPASRPASSTSSWLSASPEMPAARFVTSEMPSTSRPASRAAVASSAVDTPT